MKLFKGKAYWPSTYEAKPFGPQKGELSCDVLVVGGGMSGMLSAYVLAKAGYKVVVLEKDRIAEGSSSLNTGLIQYMSDAILSDLIKSYGRDIAASFYHESLKALDLIEELAADVPERAHFRRNGSLYLAMAEGEIQDLQTEVHEQNLLNIPAQFLSQERLSQDYGINAHGAILSRRDVEVNPYRLVASLAEVASDAHGLIVSEETQVKEDNLDLESKTFQNEHLKVDFDKLVLATGYDFLPHIKKLIPEARLISTFATITKPLQGARPAKDLMVWESAESYLYFRSAPDGRLIIGGADEKDEALSEDKAWRVADRLIEKVQRYLTEPLDLKAEFAYEAIFGESDDLLPYLGPHPDYPEVFIIHGVGGNGTVYSAMAANQMLDFMQGSLKSELSYLWPGPKRLK